jgi:hypothetical protein
MSEREIFTAALNLTDPAERSAYLDRVCGDAALRQRVELLLRTHGTAGDFLQRPAVQLAASGVTPDDSSALGPSPDGDVAVTAQGDEPGEDDFRALLQPATRAGAFGRLGHYEVLEVLGRGGFGVVVRAFDERLQRVVAVKVMAPALAATSPSRRRFLREARSAAAVRHDNVVAIHAVEEQPLPYLVMEYVDGETLQQRIDRLGPLDVPAVLRIGRQIASGLAAAHKQGLVHRDIKPANILLEHGVDRVKISDFGLARAADDASLSQSGFIAGTPLYMAPEQACGEALDPRTDLFSLGSVLYVMATGRPPFRAPTTLAVLKRVAEDTPRPIREIIPEVPEWLCALIVRLHAKKPEDRFASAQEVADLLAGFRTGPQPPGGEPTADPRPTLAPRPASDEAAGNVASPPARRRGGLMAAAVLLLLLAGWGLAEAAGVSDVRGLVIRLFSPEGTLVVEVDDPAVSVAIEGEAVVITGAGAREIRLKPGRYKVEASKDGKVVRQELVSVTRNGRQVVRISKEVEPTEAERWERSVARMPAEKQVKAVALRLKELNPAFDGKVTPTIENGVVTALRFQTDEVDDVSPLRVLTGLVALECPGTYPNKGKLSDLSPLRGRRLTRLRCEENPVTDLSPLRGMPLTVLTAGETRVSDLSPLRGMRLTTLTLQSTGVKDLSPLKGMPLRWLDLAGSRGVSDLGPLRGMPLEYLNLTALPVSDISVLASLKPLRRLLLESMPVSDLTPLHGLGLNDLSLKGTKVTDLSPIKRLPLQRLQLDYRADREKFLRSLPGLESINDKPAAEFWKEVSGK